MIYNKKVASNLNIPSEENNDTVKAKRDKKENIILSDDIINSAKGNKEINNNNRRYVGDDVGETNVVSSIESGKTYLLSDEIKLNANAIILNDGDLSNEKGPGINNNKSQKENIETDKQARYNSMYKTNRNYTRIVREDTRARLDKTNIVYH